MLSLLAWGQVPDKPAWPGYHFPVYCTDLNLVTPGYQYIHVHVKLKCISCDIEIKWWTYLWILRRYKLAILSFHWELMYTTPHFHGVSTHLSYLLLNNKRATYWLVLLIVLRQKFLTLKLYIYCRLDKTLWHLMGAIWPISFKKLMQEDFPWKLISHPRLSRISAFSETDHLVPCRSKGSHFLRIYSGIFGGFWPFFQNGFTVGPWNLVHRHHIPSGVHKLWPTKAIFSGPFWSRIGSKLGKKVSFLSILKKVSTESF